MRKTGFKNFVRNLNVKYLGIIKKHYWLTLIIYLALTGFFAYQASNIGLNTRILDLLPEDKQSVKDLKNVVDYYGGEGYLIAVIEWNYLYKDTLEWVESIKEKTIEIKEEYNKVQSKNDPEVILNWYKEQKGKLQIKNLITLYKSTKDKITQQKIEHAKKIMASEQTKSKKIEQKLENYYDKYLGIFEIALKDEVISHTIEKSKNLQKELSYFEELLNKNKDNKKQINIDPLFEAVDLFLYALDDNINKFNKIYEIVQEKKGGKKVLIDVAEKLSKDLEKAKDSENKDLIKYVEFKFRTNFIKDNLLYFIDEEDLTDIKERIDKKITYERRTKIFSKHLTRGVSKPVKLDFKDIEDKYEKSTKVLKVTSKTDLFERSKEEFEYYINKDNDRLLLLIKPAKESTDIGFAKELFEKACEVARNGYNHVSKTVYSPEAGKGYDSLACKVSHRKSPVESMFNWIGDQIKSVLPFLFSNKQEAQLVNNAKYPKELSIGYTGRYVKKIEDAKFIDKDLKTITPLALIFIFLSIFIYFRKLRAVLVVGLPLVSGLVWSVGMVSLTIGHFNIVTGFLIAILGGLGVDFGVHLFARYVEERNRGRDVFEALEIVFKTTFLSNLTSTATTAAAFLVLIISQFKGFSQFGYTAGVGMLLLLLGILFAFPSFIVISEKIRPLKTKKSVNHVDNKKGKKLPYYRLIIIGSILFLFISFFGLFNAKFNANFYYLGADNTMGKKLEKKAEELIKMSLWPVIIYAKDWETMTKITQKINELTDKNQLTTLDKVDSLYNYIPENQKEKKLLMLKIKESLRDSILSKLKGEEKKKVTRLREIVDASSIKKEHVPHELQRQFFGNLPKKFKVDYFEEKVFKKVSKESKMVINAVYKKTKNGKFYKLNKDIPKKVIDEVHAIFHDVGISEYFIFFYPKSNLNMSRAGTIKRLVKDIDKIYAAVDREKIIIASDAVIFNDILELIKSEGPIIVLLAIFAIIFLLWLDFRNFKHVFMALFPLGIGVLWIFGWIFLFGWSFNYFNVVMFPVIIGLGIDYGVHFLHRYIEEGHKDAFFVVRTTGMAILIGALTDIVGFGALMLALYRGVKTMGQVAVFGILSCVLAGILFLAAILELKNHAKKVGLKNAVLGNNKSDKKE